MARKAYFSKAFIAAVTAGPLTMAAGVVVGAVVSMPLHQPLELLTAAFVFAAIVTFWSLPVWAAGILIIGFPAWWLAHKTGSANAPLASVVGAAPVGAIWFWYGQGIGSPLGYSVIGALAGAAAGGAAQMFGWAPIEGPQE